MVTIQLGPTLVVDDIKEGDDVYFECHVRANPDWKRLQWFHNVSTITQLLHAGEAGGNWDPTEKGGSGAPANVTSSRSINQLIVCH